MSEDTRKKIEKLKAKLYPDDLFSKAKAWWEEWEKSASLDNQLELLKELDKKESNICEFFWAYVHAENDNVAYELAFLDYIKSHHSKALSAHCKRGDFEWNEELKAAGEFFRKKFAEEGK